MALDRTNVRLSESPLYCFWESGTDCEPWYHTVSWRGQSCQRGLNCSDCVGRERNRSTLWISFNGSSCKWKHGICRDIPTSNGIQTQHRFVEKNHLLIV